MSKKVLIMGCSHSQGISSKSGKPFSMGSLLVAMPVRSWSSDKGQGFGFGFQCDPKTDKFDLIKSPELLEKIAKVSFPARLELILEPDPENPLVDLVADFNILDSFSFVDSKPLSK